MNTPTPVPTSVPVKPTVSLATKTLVGGAPLSVILIWLITSYGHAQLTDVEAAAIASVGSSAIGYVWHVLEALLAKAGINPASP